MLWKVLLPLWRFLLLRAAKGITSSVFTSGGRIHVSPFNLQHHFLLVVRGFVGTSSSQSHSRSSRLLLAHASRVRLWPQELRLPRFGSLSASSCSRSVPRPPPSARLFWLTIPLASVCALGHQELLSSRKTTLWKALPDLPGIVAKGA